MNRRIVVRGVLIITVSLIVGLAIYAFYNTPQGTKPTEVEAMITDFTVDWGHLQTIVGVTTVISFNVTIKNTGTENISDMKVKLSILSNGTATQIEETNLYNYGYNFTLTRGETTSKTIDFFVDLDTQQQMHKSNQNFLVTLVSNSTVLDERKLF